MDEMSAILNLIEGTKQLAEERAERVANIQNEREKQDRLMKEQQTQADAPEETPEELQEQVDALNKALAEVTAKLNKGDAE